ncbi:hypothetical protein TBK1r_41690 [Stieleria magnilauensis]|uniref:Uncharacterized protein n=1 Tax=Stieleria magnilauensis TaxID=2527963 RepID=A0ABX5XT76_9BACT|nr:hypothetical protein TBK1r_41690 [Planctomycetes bacterium TBK1r]
MIAKIASVKSVIKSSLLLDWFDHTDEFTDHSDVVRLLTEYFNWLEILIERLELNRLMLPTIFGCLLDGMISLDDIPAAVFWIGLRVDLNK